MAESPFRRAVAAALRPLAFAARDGFAHLDRVQEFEASVQEALRVAARLAIPRDVVAKLEEVARRFEKPLGADAARSEIEAALEALAPLAEPAYSEALLARGTQALPGIGPQTARSLARRGLSTVEDLLFHLPVRWDDRRELARVGELEVGRRAVFVARVLGAGFMRRGGRSSRGRAFEAVVGDDSGTVNLKWFRGGEAIARVVETGTWLLVAGDVKRYRFSKEIAHPEVERVEGPNAAVQGAVVPEYAAPDRLHPRTLRRAVERAVAGYADVVPGFLPERVARERGIPEPAQALRALHAPAPDADLEALREGRDPARLSLVLEELYLLELGLVLRKSARSEESGTAIDAAPVEVALPFELTRAQRRACDEIRADLARPHPMSRLLEGDVGSGKTVVAFLSAVAVAASGHQSALMAPTELLAEQHARTLHALAAGAGEPLRLALLTASVARPQAQEVRARLASGEIDLVVGTHALLQEGVAFRSLAFTVIDEQHRFGVRQRAALAAKGAEGRPPHVLVMTATPIPRTLALTAHGDLDLSVLDELPPGRSAPRTLLLREGEGRRVMALMRETLARGERAYVVYPLVEESENSDLRAASESAEKIQRAFSAHPVELVHGRLDAGARARAMDRFVRGEAQILVSTTVIEVGVDVPEATLMVVEHAERFGLAQLHQLRGRVGRGERPGTCALVARSASEDSEARLSALLRTTDGFAIAEADLGIRGPGEFLGTRQHGRLPDLRIADLVRDVRAISHAREAALATVRRDPGLRGSPELLRAVGARWGDRLELAGTA